MPSGRQRRVLIGEEGHTLIELGVAGMVTSIAITIFLAALTAAQGTIVGQVERSSNNDQVRLAVQQLDRQIRSGNLLYNPDREDPKHFGVRVYSQSNAVYRCIQWRIDDRKLQTRNWKPKSLAPDDPDPSDWLTVATNVVNRDPDDPVFVLSEPTPPVGRTLNVSILVNADPDRYPDRTVRIDEALTGRNTTRGFQQDECDPAPDP